ncbi:MurR/RpiR family transcriptional regulator [Erysipelothrix sp. HDW6C]|uniref:MurR/RpiR family transcriptional regulator n=1 Tax=Erysipelothrix sp. HDW6C TaxID=2714930 RepID=UPI00140C60D7|nr:MurR/RpiR family transcriptional regulator [Erysipelothrix sp. HDW6C]QIK70282.1 MurR/RpiR family transcriptional regulator [Erysipelothrix sp. HDW6C]
MPKFQPTIAPRLESEYTNFSGLERKVADFFMSNTEVRDFSAKSIAKKLYVSEATLSRFAKKAGFSGYREFIFFYEKTLNRNAERFTELTQNVLITYKELLDKTNALINEKQITNLSKALSQAKRVYIYGAGSSGMAAQEFKIRFMRLGMYVEAVTDDHIMKMSSILMDSETVLICISVSGMNMRKYLRKAHEVGAYTVMITANNSDVLKAYCKEVLICASIENLEVGNVISPQFPVLVIIDILYAHFLARDYKFKSKLLQGTLAYVEKES